jgi:NADH-quinone oxidoreductase subunit J
MASLSIALLVLGAVGLFLALPGGRASVNRVGLVLLAAAGGVLWWLVADLVAPSTDVTTFAISSLVALFGGVQVLVNRTPVYSALYFILLMVAATALLLQLQAQFLAVALVIVYAGAILVTYMFVIMLAQQSRPAAYDTVARAPFMGCVAGFALLMAVIWQQGLFGEATDELAGNPGLADAVGTTEAIGIPLLTTYVVGIQIIGVLLLAAMVGAIAIARRKATEVPEEEAA